MLQKVLRERPYLVLLLGLAVGATIGSLTMWQMQRAPENGILPQLRLPERVGTRKCVQQTVIYPFQAVAGWSASYAIPGETPDIVAVLKHGPSKHVAAWLIYNQTTSYSDLSEPYEVSIPIAGRHATALLYKLQVQSGANFTGTSIHAKTWLLTKGWTAVPSPATNLPQGSDLYCLEVVVQLEGISSPADYWNEVATNYWDEVVTKFLGELLETLSLSLPKTKSGRMGKDRVAMSL